MYHHHVLLFIYDFVGWQDGMVHRPILMGLQGAPWYLCLYLKRNPGVCVVSPAYTPILL